MKENSAKSVHVYNCKTKAYDDAGMVLEAFYASQLNYKQHQAQE